jgi:hypothetical protein
MGHTPLLDALDGLWIIWAIKVGGCALVLLVAWAITYATSARSRRVWDRSSAVVLPVLLVITPIGLVPVAAEHMSAAQVRRVCTPSPLRLDEPEAIPMPGRALAALDLPALEHGARLRVAPMRDGWVGGYTTTAGGNYALVLLSFSDRPRSSGDLARLLRGHARIEGSDWWSLRDGRLFIGPRDSGSVEERDASLRVIQHYDSLRYPGRAGWWARGEGGALYFTTSPSNAGPIRLWRVPRSGPWTHVDIDRSRASYRPDTWVGSASGGVCLVGRFSERGDFYAGAPPRPTPRPWGEVVVDRYGPTWPALVLALVIASIAIARVAVPVRQTFTFYRANVRDGLAVVRDGTWYWHEGGVERAIRGVPRIELVNGEPHEPAPFVAWIEPSRGSTAPTYREPDGSHAIEVQALFEGSLRDLRRARREAIFGQLPFASLWLGFCGVLPLLIVLGYLLLGFVNAQFGGL